MPDSLHFFLLFIKKKKKNNNKKLTGGTRHIERKLIEIVVHETTVWHIGTARHLLMITLVAIHDHLGSYS